jgi:DNA polymerase III subunit delta
MAAERSPEEVLAQLKSGTLSPLFLFYGQSEFRMEKVLTTIREGFIPGSVRDFNLQMFYGDETDPGGILESARSLPFMCAHRLIIVRRTESFSAGALERFLPYLEDPTPSTCLLFVSSKTDFKRKFYKKFKEIGLAVHFKPLQENQIVPWIRRTAGEMGLKIDGRACAFLQQVVGNRLRDLYPELEKLSLRYGDLPVGVEEVRASSLRSRSYTIFELMDQISFRRCPESLSVLDRLLQESDRDGVLGTLGMMTRQVRLLWRVKALCDAGGEKRGMAAKLGIPDFLLPKLIQQGKEWKVEELESAFDQLCRADELLKSGSSGRLVLENLVFSLCG